MSNSVNVLCRVRPINDIECVSLYNENCLLLGNRPFTFDGVYKSNSTNTSIFEDACIPLLNKFIDGFNCTMLAYGQTFSGKTYTMGTDVAYKDGIIPNAMKWLFEQIKDKNDTDIYISFLELYNEEFIDLLNVENQPKIREIDNQIQWTNVHQQSCSSYSDALECLYKGSSNRKTGSTDMNATSSRSHAIFAVGIKSPTINSRFNFVDLAGSERLKRTNASGIRQKEGISINSGLLALGNVIYALSVQSQHIPYRDSKLTRILQDSLGGNAYTTMIACISPKDSDFAETLNTLKYASRAREIQNMAVRNLIDTDNDVDKLKEIIRQLRMENEELKNSKHYHPQSDLLIKENKALKLDLELQKGKYDDMIVQMRMRSLSESEGLSKIDKRALSPIQEQHKVYTNIIEQLRKRLRRFQRIFQPKVRHSWHQINQESEWEDLEGAIEDVSDSNESSLLDEQQISAALTTIQGNIQVQEDLVQKLELSQNEYQELKTKYETKMDDLQRRCKEISKERDIFLKKSSDGTQIKEMKLKYEDKLSKIQNELVGLKGKHQETEKALIKIREKAKLDVEHMKSNIVDLRREKSKLLQQVKLENEKARRQTVRSEQAVYKLRTTELRSVKMAERYETDLKFQVVCQLI